jgi:hypothetical protein
MVQGILDLKCSNTTIASYVLLLDKLFIFLSQSINSNGIVTKRAKGLTGRLLPLSLPERIWCNGRHWESADRKRLFHVTDKGRMVSVVHPSPVVPLRLSNKSANEVDCQCRRFVTYRNVSRAVERTATSLSVPICTKNYYTPRVVSNFST